MIDSHDIVHTSVKTASDGYSPDSCPHVLGSPEAKAWWNDTVVPAIKKARTDAPAEVKAKYGDNMWGFYKGKPLVPGVAGKDQGDMTYVIDKIRVEQGLDSGAAYKIASKAFKKAFPDK